VKQITEEGGQVILNDINEERLEILSKKYNANVVLGNDIYGLDTHKRKKKKSHRTFKHI